MARISLQIQLTTAEFGRVPHAGADGMAKAFKKFLSADPEITHFEEEQVFKWAPPHIREKIRAAWIRRNDASGMVIIARSDQDEKDADEFLRSAAIRGHGSLVEVCMVNPDTRNKNGLIIVVIGPWNTLRLADRFRIAREFQVLWASIRGDKNWIEIYKHREESGNHTDAGGKLRFDAVGGTYPRWPGGELTCMEDYIMLPDGSLVTIEDYLR
jgi:hypothetical protein